MKAKSNGTTIPAVKVLALLLALLLALTASGISPGVAHAEEPGAPDAASSEPTPEPEPEPTPQPEPTPVPEEAGTKDSPAEASAPPEAAPMARKAPMSESEKPEDGAGKIITVDGYPCVAGEVLVQFRRNASKAAVRSALKAVDAENPEEITGNLHVVEVPEGETIPGYIKTLESHPDVLFAQPNYVYYLPKTQRVPVGSLPENRSPMGVTNDEYLIDQWYLDKIGVFDAWDTTMGDSGVYVAVLDTGVEIDHPDLAGRIDLARSIDVVDEDGSVQDDDGHGTHVAGIIAAAADNGMYGAGVAPGVKLIIVDVFHMDFYIFPDEPDVIYVDLYSTSEDIAKGIYHAINNGADVINMSLGGYYPDKVEIDAVNAAAAAGVVVVAAAGNESTSQAVYPGDLESVICVTATGPNDEFASYSNYGPAKDIAAPGGNGDDYRGWILSTYPHYDFYTGEYTGGMIWMGGTSMAAPVVSGVVALMLSADSSLSVNDVKNKLYNSAVDLGAKGKDNYFGHGRVNAASAVRSVRGISTSSYTIDRRNSFLTGVPVGTSLSNLQSALTIPFGALSIYDAQGNPVTQGVAKTDMKVRLIDEQMIDDNVVEVVKDELTIAVKGDVSGDGDLTIADYTLLRVYLLNLYTLSPAAVAASDTNGDGTLNVADYTNIKLALLKEKPL